MNKTQPKRLADIIRRYVSTVVASTDERLAAAEERAVERLKEMERRMNHFERRIDDLFARIPNENQGK